VVRISNKTISLLDNTTIIAQLFKDSDPEITQKDLINKSRKIVLYLKCISNRRISRIIYALSLCRLSTASVLSEHLGVSRDTVMHYVIKAVNAGLVEIKTENDSDYPTLHEFWKNNVRNTHESTKLLLATTELIATFDLLKEYMNDTIDQKVRQKLFTFGKSFDRHITGKEEHAAERNHKILAEERDIIGACIRCSKALTTQHRKGNQSKMIAGELYCRSCADQMFDDGEISKLYKRHNGNHGHH
jgi:hypothetical protein